jgi:hypothetical protein
MPPMSLLRHTRAWNHNARYAFFHHQNYQHTISAHWVPPRGETFLGVWLLGQNLHPDSVYETS